jgi:hypothetical protein
MPHPREQRQRRYSTRYSQPQLDAEALLHIALVAQHGGHELGADKGAKHTDKDVFYSRDSCGLAHDKAYGVAEGCANGAPDIGIDKNFLCL